MSRWTCALLLFPLLAGCAASHDLTPEQHAKLDARLQVLLAKGAGMVPDDMDSSVRPDGTREYAVVIHGGSAGELRAAGVPVAGGIGAISTARVSLEELKSLARITTVRSIETAKIVRPNK